MPLKGSRPPTEYEEIDRWDGGVGWLAYPDERMARASHALRVSGTSDEYIIDFGSDHEERSEQALDSRADVWLVDPLRAPGVEEMLREFGDVVGVVVLLDRHSRDAVTFARRFDVPLYLPAWIDVEVPEDVGIVRIDERLPGTEFELLETVDLPRWHEAALYDGETLLVADALGTASYFTTSEESVGVHPMLRLFPPKALEDCTPDRILTGHGVGVKRRASSELTDALENSRARTHRVWWNALKGFIGRNEEDKKDEEDEATGIDDATFDTDEDWWA